MPTVTREWKITWGSFVVGGTTEYLLDGQVLVERGFEQASVTFDVTVTRSTEAAFITACTTLEDEFSKRDQAILFDTVGGSTFVDLDPADNTGFNSTATVTKSGDTETDTGRSRKYRVTLACELPADDASGRRTVSIAVAYNASNRRRVTISGTYTALTSNDATDQYAATIAAYCSSILTGIDNTATFELIEQNTDRDRNDKLIQFSRVYEEIIKNQSSGTLNDSSVVSHSLTFTTQRLHTGDSTPNTRRLERILASWACAVDVQVTTDVESLWTNTIRPYIVSEFSSRFNASDYGVEQETPTYDDTENRLTASMTFLAAVGTATVVESTIRMGFNLSDVFVFSLPWDGNRYSAYVDEGKASLFRFVESTVTVLGGEAPLSRLNIQPNDPRILGGGLKPEDTENDDGSGGMPGSWYMVDANSSVLPGYVGQPGQQLRTSTRMDRIVERYVEAPSSVAAPSSAAVVTPSPGGSGVFTEPAGSVRRFR